MYRLLSLTIFLLFFSKLHAQVGLVKDIFPGSGSSNAGAFTAFGNALYLVANDGINGQELWRYDGTNPPTMVLDLNPGQADGILNPQGQFPIVNGKMFFAGNNGNTGFEIYSYDGSNPPTIELDMNSGPLGASPIFMVTDGTKIFFSAALSGQQRKLWSYNPSSSVLTLLTDQPQHPTTPENIYYKSNSIYFSGHTAAGGNELWSFNVNSGIIKQYPEINPGPANATPRNFCTLNNTLYFVAVSAASGREIYSLDADIVHRRTDIAFGFGDGITNVGRGLGAYNGKLYFSGSKEGATYLNAKLLSYNPLDSVVKFIIANGDTVRNPSDFEEVNNTLYFSAFDNAKGQELWKIENNLPRNVVDLEAGFAGSNPTQLYGWNNKLYFQAYKASTGTEMYVTPFALGLMQGSGKSASVVVYPNPAVDEVQFSLNSFPCLNCRELKVFNSLGRIMSSTVINVDNGPANNDITLFVGRWPAGLYYYQIAESTNEIKAQGRFLKL